MVPESWNSVSCNSHFIDIVHIHKVVHLYMPPPPNENPVSNSAAILFIVFTDIDVYNTCYSPAV